MEDYRAHIEDKLKLLPNLPGCYLMKDEKGEIIYVGKAKNLKNRVRSYFKQAHDGKTQLLVNDIRDFETIVTNTNKESLLLEITLIKKHQPKYNIKLKDGTMYPYIKITHERNPQLLIANKVKEDGGLYFGPYPNVGAANQTLQLLQKTFPLRRCGKNEKRACFYYHIGQCIGCCDHDVPVEVYQQQIDKISRFLNGDVGAIKKTLKEKMLEASAQLDFERAADYRDQIRYVEETVEKQTILSDEFTNHDLFNFYEEDGLISIQVFFLRQAALIKREATIYACFQSPEEELLSFILQFYDNHPLPKEILIPEGLDKELLDQTLDAHILVPKKGKKKSLLDLAKKNSQIALEEQKRLSDLKTEKTLGAAQELAEALSIPSATVIESFDHSHIQGTNPVSALVVYVDGKPQPKLYRKYKVKTVVGANEFATTQEIIRRRYIRLLQEGKPLPDLILMDGGPIQVNAAREVLEDELGLSIPVAGMVKNDKHQTANLIFGDQHDIIPLDPRSQAFRLLQRIQEEVHRFAISFHRQLRSKNTLASRFDEIPGVGEKTRKKLLIHYRHLQDLETASLEDLKKIGISPAIAKKILGHFQDHKAGDAPLKPSPPKA